ncbi:hypothetical protein [Burkholderia ambifaria]|uniref:Uncharacterized protein n=1 Tax=Burkholderia ambifaria TaxID=152480 RepID=A0AA41JMZ3_9BURK|nr:hypothetical protein [Burkholderia ambifaria]MBR8133239.1 hypothetical protein [Burkholderia ambifaria]
MAHSFRQLREASLSSDRKRSDRAKPKIAFLLKGRACGFGVISLNFDPAYPDYWIATGYRSLDDYKRDSTDALSCSMELERLKP